MTEPIDHPDYYGGDTPYETIKVLDAWMSPAGRSAFEVDNGVEASDE